MLVKDLILYQVSTDRNYQIGDILNFGSSLNGLGERVFNSKFNNGQISYHKLGFDYANSKKLLKKKKFLIELCNSFSEMDFVLRELATEAVRKEKFTEKPSRFKCMFLSDSKEDVLKNLKTAHKKGFGNHFQAISVRLNGEIFYAKNVGLQRNGLSYNEYKNIAESYWKQDQDSTEKTKEILFVGKAEVIEIFGEYIKK